METEIDWDRAARVMSNPLAEMLDVAVPLKILALKDRGGPSREDWRWIATHGIPILDELSEYLLHKGLKKSDSEIAFNAAAKSIAILAFVPHGITVFGRSWEAR